MASSLHDIFGRLWSTIDDTVSHLLKTEHQIDLVCEQLQWLSNCIDAASINILFEPPHECQTSESAAQETIGPTHGLPQRSPAICTPRSPNPLFVSEEDATADLFRHMDIDELQNRNAESESMSSASCQIENSPSIPTDISPPTPDNAAPTEPREVDIFNDFGHISGSRSKRVIKPHGGVRVRHPRPPPAYLGPRSPLLKSRKRPINHHEGATSKRSKIEANKGMLTSLMDLDATGQSVINPGVLYERLLNCCPGVDDRVAGLLFRVFFSIASPQAILQLKDACAHVRGHGGPVLPQSGDTAAHTIHALDTLEMAAGTHSILRRFHLTRLIMYRDKREEQHQADQQSKDKPRLVTRSQAKQRRIASLAIADLVAEAYPYVEKPPRSQSVSGTEYEKKRTAVSNMLKAGRNWNLLQQEYSPGVLALVLTGRDCGIQNSDIERLPLPVFKAFLEILLELRGIFIKQISKAVSQRVADVLSGYDLSSKYIFESTEEKSLRSHPLDAPDLVALCAAR